MCKGAQTRHLRAATLSVETNSLREKPDMSLSTLLLIVIIVMLLGGGGFYFGR